MELSTIAYLVIGLVAAVILVPKVIAMFSGDNRVDGGTGRSRTKKAKEHVLVCGPSGSGKTSLVQLLATG
jgi:ABC-type lipoprotein export system ATPase subunit